MNFVRNGQLLATFCTTSCQYATAISSLHTLTETMLVVSLTIVGLECSFHFLLCYFFVFWYTYHRAGKVSTNHFKVGLVSNLGLSFRFETPSHFGVQSYENFCEWTKFVAWKVVSFSVLGISVLLLCYLFYLFVSMIALEDYKPVLKRLACSAMSSASSK